MNRTQTYYPLGHHHDEISALLKELSGKKIALGHQEDDESAELAEDALNLFKHLVMVDRFMAPNLNLELGKIVRDYTETLSARSAELCHSIRYDRPQAGYRDYRDPTSVSEMYVTAECGADKKAQSNYVAHVFPILKLHNCLIHNCETIYQNDAFKLVLEKVVQTGDDINYIFNEMRDRDMFPELSLTRSSDIWAAVKRRALGRKNNGGYLYFPEFTNAEIEYLASLHKIRVTSAQKAAALEKSGLCEADIEKNPSKKNEYYRNVHLMLNNWTNYGYIDKLLADPNSGSVKTAMAYYSADASTNPLLHDAENEKLYNRSSYPYGE